MPVDQNNLIWIDMEMTGLQPDADRIIEIALLVTDAQLVTVAEGPVMVIHQPGEVLDAMDAWNKATHAKTGLIERVRSSRLTEAQAERSEEHTSEFQSRLHLVCRLLLEKKKMVRTSNTVSTVVTHVFPSPTEPCRLSSAL